MLGMIKNDRAILALLLCGTIILAGLSGCAATSAEKAPPVAQISATIKLEATSSTWREGEEPYDIYSATKKELEGAGFKVVSKESASYDATLFVDYKETKSGKYLSGSYGTSIKCNLRFCDKTDNLLFEKEISACTSFSVKVGSSLYEDAVSNFENEPYLKYLGEILATKFGVGDKVSVLISALKDRDSNTRWKAASALGEKKLGEIGDTRAVEPLIQLLRDEVRGVRMSAARALGRIGDERAIEPLTDALEDEDSLVQKAVRKALEEIEGK